MTARGVALAALARIRDGAYANLVLPTLLDRSKLDQRDRNFVTELVYGTTRMRRACDHAVDRFLARPEIDPDVRDALQLGAYQLLFLDTPAHAAVGETVSEVRGRARGLVNAVLRKVATTPIEWPDEATRLSYPDWVVERLRADLGSDDAAGALETMNGAAPVHQRADGYVQDPASEQVAMFVGAEPGDRVADVCAAPGGKSTAIAHDAGIVVAGDVHFGRSGLISANAHHTGTAEHLAVVVADARRASHPPRSFDRVLVDAPCSGLGVLRRRPDARWRIASTDVDELVALQKEILTEAAGLVRPGGRVIYSVCTLTEAEGPGMDRWLEGQFPHLRAVAPPPAPWRSIGRGARLLPQDAETDGMYVLGLTNAAGAAG